MSLLPSPLPTKFKRVKSKKWNCLCCRYSSLLPHWLKYRRGLRPESQSPAYLLLSPWLMEKCNLSTFKKRSKECAKGPYHIQVSHWWTHCVIRVNVYLCVDTFWAFPMSWVLRTLQLCSSCQISSRRFCKINEHRWKQNNIQCWISVVNN